MCEKSEIDYDILYSWILLITLRKVIQFIENGWQNSINEFSISFMLCKPGIRSTGITLDVGLKIIIIT